MSIQRRKSFKTAVSIVSANVRQKVVTMRCSSTTPPPPPTEEMTNLCRNIPKVVHVPCDFLLHDGFCCSPVPTHITSDEQDVASEVTLDFFVKELVPSHPPGGGRKVWRKFSCLPESGNACGLNNSMETMDWPSDEDEDEGDDDKDMEYHDRDDELAPDYPITQFLRVPKLDQTCGMHFWTTDPQNLKEGWGLIADRDDKEEEYYSMSSREHVYSSSASTYETRERVNILGESI